MKKNNDKALINKSPNDVFIIAGMPLEDFPKPPSEHPGSELAKCPQCNKQMWLSKKKRQMILSMDDPFVACWPCLFRMKRNGDFADADIEAFNI